VQSEYLARITGQLCPQGGQLNRFSLPEHQFSLGMALQSLHVQADGGLGAAEHFGRPGVTLAVDDRDQRPEQIGGNVQRFHL